MERLQYHFWKTVRRIADYVHTWSGDIYAASHKRFMELVDQRIANLVDHDPEARAGGPGHDVR